MDLHSFSFLGSSFPSEFLSKSPSVSKKEQCRKSIGKDLPRKENNRKSIGKEVPRKENERKSYESQGKPGFGLKKN